MTWGHTGGVSSGGTGTSASITHGLTINSGDTVLAYINCNNTGAISNDAGGAAWLNPVNETPSGETARHALFRKTAGASEPATYSWTLPASTQYRVVLMVFTSTGTVVVDTAAVTAKDLSSVPNLVCEATNGITVSDNSLSVVFGGKDNRNPTSAYTTADNSYTGVVGDAADQSAAGAYRVFTTGQTLPAAVTLSGAVDDNDSTYSIHISLVESVTGNTITANQTEEGDATAASFQVINEVTANQTEAGDTTAASLQVLAQITADQAEAGDSQVAAIEVAPLEANITANQTEAGDTTAASLQVLAQITANQTETGDSQSADLTVVPLGTRSITANQTEAGDVTTASLATIVQLSANQTEAGDTTAANLSNIAQITANQSDEGDSQTASIQTQFEANIIANQQEAGDGQLAALGVIVQLSANQQEEGDVTLAAIGSERIRADGTVDIFPAYMGESDVNPAYSGKVNIS